MRTSLAVAAALATLAGCATSSMTDLAPPVLEVTAPARGTMDGDPTVTVTGRVTDDGGAPRVTVNGAPAEVGKDGTFAAEVALPPGVTVIETVATDRAGKTARDVRAVLGGPLLPAGQRVEDALGAHLGPAGLTVLGKALAAQLAALDLTALVAAANPVYDNSGCLGAKVNVTKVKLTGATLGLTPTAGSLKTHVDLAGVEVDLHADYKVACIGGSTNLKLTATHVRVDGGLAVAVAGSALDTTLRNVTVALDGFHLDVGGLPGAVDNLVSGAIHDRVATALADAVRAKVPPMADQALAQLTGRPLAVSVLGADVSVAVKPTSVAIDAGGLRVAVAATAKVAGGDGAEYLSAPMPVADVLPTTGGGLAVALADDLVNQLFAGLWAAGALDQHLPLDANSPLFLFLDEATRSLDLEFALPPTVSGEGETLRFAVGDMIVVARDEAGAELSRFAMSITTTLAAASSGGQLALQLGDPTVKAQVLAESPAVTRHLDGEKLEGLVTGVWGVVAPMANDALGQVALPSLAGVTIASPAVTGKGSYALVDGDVARVP